jgi:hypothetical protein
VTPVKARWLTIPEISEERFKENWLLANCRVALAKEFVDSSISWEGLSAALDGGPGARFMARSHQLPETAEARETYPILKLAEWKGRSYWVAIVLTFRWKLGELALQNIGILLFRGAGLAGTREIVLRAEWDRDAKHSAGQHAQPHWHVYGSRLTPFETHHYLVLDETEGLTEIGSEVFNAVETIDRDEDLRRFHLAMCARWHLDEKELHYEAPEDAKVERWLRNCVRYIREQLEYLSEESPPAPPASLPF